MSQSVLATSCPAWEGGQDVPAGDQPPYGPVLAVSDYAYEFLLGVISGWVYASLVDAGV